MEYNPSMPRLDTTLYEEPQPAENSEGDSMFNWLPTPAEACITSAIFFVFVCGMAYLNPLKQRGQKGQLIAPPRDSE